MFWLGIAILGYALLAIVAIMDKHILTDAVQSPAVYTFYSTIFLAGALVVLPFGGGFLVGFDWIWAIVSGVSFGFALWTMYIAFLRGEASHMAPFIGGIVTLCSFIFGFVLLGEALTLPQIVGMIILVVATFLLSFEQTISTMGMHVGFLWGIASGALYGISHVSAKYLYESYDFLTSFAWSRASIALLGVALLASPVVRNEIGRKKKRKKREKSLSTLALVVSSKGIGVVAVILIQYAIAIGSVTVVNALAGVQFAVLFLLIVLFTLFSPRTFKEFMTRREIAVQSIAIIFVVIGSIIVTL